MITRNGVPAAAVVVPIANFEALGRRPMCCWPQGRDGPGRRGPHRDHGELLADLFAEPTDDMA